MFDEFPRDDYKWFSPGSRSLGQLVHCFRLVETLRGLELKKYYYDEAKFHYTITRITLATGFDDPWTPGRPWSNRSSLQGLPSRTRRSPSRTRVNFNYLLCQLVPMPTRTL